MVSVLLIALMGIWIVGVFIETIKHYFTGRKMKKEHAIWYERVMRELEEMERRLDR